VYRRSSENRNEVAGTLERVGTRQQHAFIDLSELQNTLQQLIKSDDAETRLVELCGRDEQTMTD
jgi:hypothetical protein